MLLKTFFFYWLMPNEQKFIQSFEHNENMSNYARSFVDSLEYCDQYVFYFACVLVAVVSCVGYYTWYCNVTKPFYGYHYRFKHLLVWFAVSLAISCGSALGICLGTLEHTDLDGTGKFIASFCVGNALYETILTFIISAVWCRWFPTNAYRWSKSKFKSPTNN